MRPVLPMALVLAAALAAGCGQDTPDRDDRMVDRDGRRTYDDDDDGLRRGTIDVKRRDADNTGRNERDRDTDLTVTPPDQSENEFDVKRTAEIRKRLTGTELSLNAKNVKIVTANGRVTLRGPVESQAEKDQVLRIARDVAGDVNVDDQLEVKTNVDDDAGDDVDDR